MAIPGSAGTTPMVNQPNPLYKLKTRAGSNTGVTGGGGVGGGTSSLPLPPYATAGGSSTTAASGGGTTSVPTVSTTAGTNPLQVTAAPSPEMQAATDAWKKLQAGVQTAAGQTDPNLQAQIDAYKQRLSTDTTQQAIDQATSAARDQAAAMGAQADIQGAKMGRGPGYAAGTIGEAAQRAAAKSASDITLGRQAQLDALVLGGQGIMSAPGQQALAYQNLLSQVYGQNPYMDTAQLGLAQQNLGLQAWQAQMDAALKNKQLDQNANGTPWDWYKLVYGNLGI